MLECAHIAFVVGESNYTFEHMHHLVVGKLDQLVLPVGGIPNANAELVIGIFEIIVAVPD